MGSSLGALIYQYGSLKYQETFSKAGLFSPAYWFSDSVWTFTHDIGKKYNMKFFQLCGTNESNDVAESKKMLSEMQLMNDTLVKIGFGQVRIFNKIVTGGQHNEKLWRKSFGEAYLWLFDTFANSIKEPAENK
jgi:alpha-glucosidase